MQPLFYITIAYLVSVLVSLITFNIFSFNNRANVMVNDDFYRVISLAIVPVFNIMLLLGILAIEFYELLICLKNKLFKKWKK